jgi:hypothetical protein
VLLQVHTHTGAHTRPLPGHSTAAAISTWGTGARAPAHGGVLFIAPMPMKKGDEIAVTVNKDS